MWTEFQVKTPVLSTINHKIKACESHAFFNMNVRWLELSHYRWPFALDGPLGFVWCAHSCMHQENIRSLVCSYRIPSSLPNSLHPLLSPLPFPSWAAPVSWSAKLLRLPFCHSQSFYTFNVSSNLIFCSLSCSFVYLSIKFLCVFLIYHFPHFDLFIKLHR